jgi:hypothetical protein
MERLTIMRLIVTPAILSPVFLNLADGGYSFLPSALAQLLRISQVLCPSGIFLIPDQGCQSDEMRRNAIENPFGPIRPDFFEADSRNGGQNIDPIRFHAQLDHLPGTCKISGLYTDLTETEFPQSLKYVSRKPGISNTRRPRTRRPQVVNFVRV